MFNGFTSFRQDLSSIKGPTTQTSSSTTSATTFGPEGGGDYSLYVSAQRFPIQSNGLKPLDTNNRRKQQPQQGTTMIKGKALNDYSRQGLYYSQDFDSGSVIYDNAPSVTSSLEAMTKSTSSSIGEVLYPVEQHSVYSSYQPSPTNSYQQQQQQQFSQSNSVQGSFQQSSLNQAGFQNYQSSSSAQQQQQPTELYKSPRRKNVDEITIHVNDDANKVNKDFVCNRDLLMNEMKYFKYYLLQPKAKNEEIDISVHCDVNIFQWLMDYIKKDPSSTPKLEVNWAISILISSHFLEMDSLVEKTLDYVRDNMDSILKLPIDLDCIQHDLLERLSLRFKDYQLDEVKDKKDKILSKLFMKKLEDLLDEEEFTLYKCQHCQTLFTKSQYEWMVCHSEKAKIQVDFHGRAISRHTVDRVWNIDGYLYKLKKSGMSWRDIYWRCWSLVHSYFCSKCKHNFVAADYAHCTYHKKDARFDKGTIVGEHPCCGAKAMKFNSGILIQKGCCAKNHTIMEYQDQDLESVDKSLNALLSKHIDVLIPFVGVSGETESSPKGEVEDDVDDMDLLKLKSKKLEEIEDEDEDEREDSMDLFTDKSCKYKIFDDFNGGNRTTLEKSNEPADDKKKVNSKRFHSMDIQRNIDRENIDDIIKTLRKCRKKIEDPPSTGGSTNNNSNKTKQTPKKKTPSKTTNMPLRSKKPPGSTSNVSSTDCCNIFNYEIHMKTIIKFQSLNKEFNEYYNERYWLKVLKSFFSLSSQNDEEKLSTTLLKSKTKISFRRLVLIFLLMRKNGIGLKPYKDSPYTKSHKILFTGKEGVGKTKCILNYCYNFTYPFDYEYDVEDSYRKSHVMGQSRALLEMHELNELDQSHLTDFGQDYLSHCSMIIVMCELFSEESVQYLETSLFPHLSEKISLGLPFIIFINDKNNVTMNNDQTTTTTNTNTNTNNTTETIDQTTESNRRRIRKDSIRSILSKFSIKNYVMMMGSCADEKSVKRLFSECAHLFAYSSFELNHQMVEGIIEKDSKVLKSSKGGCVLH